MQYSHLFGFPPLCLFKCLVKTFVRLFEFSPVCFSYVSSNDITGKKQSHTSCICSKFLHCTFSKASSNCQRERRHIRIGCIFLFFLHFVYLNVWSNCLPGRMQGHSCYIWLAFLQCVVSGQNVSLEGCKLTLVTLFFICVLKWHDREDAKSHKLHLSDFSPSYIFKGLIKLPAREKAYLHWLHFLAFLHCVYSNESSNHLP